MRRRILLSLAALSCAPLSVPETAECGNGIVELGEWCDGEEACREAEDANACSWRCDADTECPVGTCGLDGVCREPQFDLALGPVITEASAQNLQVADLDHDGRPDLVFVEASDTGWSITAAFLGTDRSVVSQTRTALGDDPLAYGIADQDGDGWEDILVASSRGPAVNVPDNLPEPETGVSRVALLRNVTGRSFAAAPAASDWRYRPPIVALEPSPPGLAELVMLDENGGLFGQFLGGEAEFQVWTGAGSPVIETDDGIALHPYPGPIECGQYTNGVMLDGATTGTVERIVGHSLSRGLCTSPGQFTQRTLSGPTGGELQPWVALLDANGDGRRDAIAQTVDGSAVRIHASYAVEDASYHSDPTPQAFPVQDGDLGFDPAPLLDYDDGGESRVMAAAHLDGDDVLDFVLATPSGPVIARSDVACTGNGWSCCSPSHACLNVQEPADPMDIGVGDFDGDGIMDILVTAVGRTDVLVSEGAEYRRHADVIAESRTALDVEVGDFDGDGRDDFALAMVDELPAASETTADRVIVGWGGASGSFEVDEIVHAPTQGGLAIAWSADAVTGPAELFALALGDGLEPDSGVLRIALDGRRWLPTVETGECQPRVMNAAAGRFDAGGVRLAASGVELGPPFLANTCTIGLNRDPGGVIRAGEVTRRGHLYGGAQPWASIAGGLAGQFDADELDELVLVGGAGYGATATVVGALTPLGDSIPVFSAFDGVLPREDVDARTSDLDGDGDLDLLVPVTSDELPSAVLVLYNRGNGSFFGGPLEIDGEAAGDIGFAAPLGGSIAGGRVLLVTAADGGEARLGSLDGAAMEVRSGTTTTGTDGTVGDFDGDGLIDLATIGSSGVRVYWGTVGDEAVAPPEARPSTCGDGVADVPFEQCDGSDLGGWDCTQLAYFGGTLLCGDDCTFDVSRCGESCLPGQCPDGSFCDAGTCAPSCESIGCVPGYVCFDDLCLPGP